MINQTPERTREKIMVTLTHVVAVMWLWAFIIVTAWQTWAIMLVVLLVELRFWIKRKWN